MTDKILQSALKNIAGLDKDLANMSKNILSNKTVDQQLFKQKLEALKQNFAIAATYIFYIKFIAKENLNLTDQQNNLLRKLTTPSEAELGIINYQQLLLLKIQKAQKAPKSLPLIKFAKALLDSEKTAKHILETINSQFIAGSNNNNENDFIVFFVNTLEALPNTQAIQDNETWKTITQARTAFANASGEQANPISTLHEQIKNLPSIKKSKPRKKLKANYQTLDSESSSDEAEQNTKGKQPLAKSKNKNSLFIMRNNKKLTFKRHPNPVHGGFCGYALFGKTPNEIKESLLYYSNEEFLRKIASTEILSAIRLAHAAKGTFDQVTLRIGRDLLEKEHNNQTGKDLIEAYDASEQALNKKITYLKDSLGLKGQKRAIDTHSLLEQLDETNKNNLENLIQNFEEAEAALISFCNSKAVYTFYVEHYIDNNGWLVFERTGDKSDKGHNLIDAIAHFPYFTSANSSNKTAVNLAIYQRNKGNQLTLVHEYNHNSDFPTLHILHRNASEPGYAGPEHYDWLALDGDKNPVKPWENPDLKTLEDRANLAKFYPDFYNDEENDSVEADISNATVPQSTTQLQQASTDEQTPLIGNQPEHVTLDISLLTPVKLKLSKQGHNAWIQQAIKASEAALENTDWKDDVDEDGFEIKVKKANDGSWTAKRDRYGIEHRILSPTHNHFTQPNNRLVIKIFAKQENGKLPYNGPKLEDFLHRSKAVYEAAVSYVIESHEISATDKLAILSKISDFYTAAREQLMAKCEPSIPSMRGIQAESYFKPIFKQAKEIVQYATTQYVYTIRPHSQGDKHPLEIAKALSKAESQNLFRATREDNINIFPVDYDSEVISDINFLRRGRKTVWQVRAQRCLGSVTAPSTMRDDPDVLPNLRIVSSGKLSYVINNPNEPGSINLQFSSPNFSEADIEYHNDIIRHTSPGTLNYSDEERITAAKHQIKILIHELLKLAFQESGQSPQQLRGKQVVLKLNTMMLLTPVQRHFDTLFRKKLAESKMMHIAYEAMKSVAKKTSLELNRDYGFSLRFEFTAFNMPVKDFKNLKGGQTSRNSKILDRLKRAPYNMLIDKEQKELNKEGFKGYVTDVNNFLSENLGDNLVTNLQSILKNAPAHEMQLLTTAMQTILKHFTAVKTTYDTTAKKYNSPLGFYKNIGRFWKNKKNTLDELHGSALIILLNTHHLPDSIEVKKIRKLCELLVEYIDTQSIFLNKKYKHNAYGHEFQMRFNRVINLIEEFLNLYCKSSEDRSGVDNDLTDGRVAITDIVGHPPQLDRVVDKQRLAKIVALEDEYGVNREINDQNAPGARAKMKNYSQYHREDIANISDLLARFAKKSYKIGKGIKIGQYYIASLPSDGSEKIEKLTDSTKAGDTFVTKVKSLHQKNVAIKNKEQALKSFTRENKTQLQSELEQLLKDTQKMFTTMAPNLVAYLYYMRFESPLTAFYYQELEFIQPFEEVTTAINRLKLIYEGVTAQDSNPKPDLNFILLKALLDETSQQADIDAIAEKQPITKMSAFKNIKDKFLAKEKNISRQMNKLIRKQHGIEIIRDTETDEPAKRKASLADALQIKSGIRELANGFNHGYKTSYNPATNTVIVEPSDIGFHADFKRVERRGYLFNENGSKRPISGRCSFDLSKMQGRHEQFMAKYDNISGRLRRGVFNFVEPHPYATAGIIDAASFLLFLIPLGLAFASTWSFPLDLVEFPTSEEIRKYMQGIGPRGVQIIQAINNATIASQVNHLRNREHAIYSSQANMAGWSTVFSLFLVIIPYLIVSYLQDEFDEIPERFIIKLSNGTIINQYSDDYSKDTAEVYAYYNGRYWQADPASAEALIKFLKLDSSPETDTFVAEPKASKSPKELSAPSTKPASSIPLALPIDQKTAKTSKLPASSSSKPSSSKGVFTGTGRLEVKPRHTEATGNLVFQPAAAELAEIFKDLGKGKLLLGSALLQALKQKQKPTVAKAKTLATSSSLGSSAASSSKRSLVNTFGSPKATSTQGGTFFKATKNPVLPIVTITDGQQFKQIDPPSDGECGYSAFGTTCKDASQALLGNINTVKDCLQPAIQEHIITNEFIQYLLDKQIIDHNAELYQAFNAYCAADQDDNNVEQARQRLNTSASSNDVICSFIRYDVEDKKIDEGWAHPAILQALAKINNKALYIWSQPDSSGREAIARPLKGYECFIPTNVQSPERIDIYYVNNNHFRQLIPVGGYNQQRTEARSSAAPTAPVFN